MHVVGAHNEAADYIETTLACMHGHVLYKGTAWLINVMAIKLHQ